MVNSYAFSFSSVIGMLGFLPRVLIAFVILYTLKRLNPQDKTFDTGLKWLVALTLVGIGLFVIGFVIVTLFLTTGVFTGLFSGLLQYFRI